MADYCWRFGLHAASPFFYYARRTILFLLIIPLANSQTLDFDYPNFMLADVNPKQEGDASVSDPVIQLTKNAVDSNSTWSVGRVTYPKQLHLWNETSKELKSFTTKFSFSVFSNQNPHGDGLAFFLASPNLTNATDIAELKGASLGIGLVDNQTGLSYQYVAVEFDTYSNVWDPDGVHVGVNINSMKSSILEGWSIDNSQRNVYDCSIEYDSRNYNLQVSFTAYRFNAGSVLVKTTQHLSYYRIDLTEHLPESVIVGISAATGHYSEEHTLYSWSFSTSLPSDDNPKNTKLWEGIGIGVGLSVSLIGLVHFLLWKINKGKDKETTSETASDLIMDDEFRMGTGPKKIRYHELVTATDNFEETQKLGRGDFGGVYKGYFKDSNSYAAIKRISADSSQGIKEYAAEVKTISQLRHRNLVQLTGWCHKKNDLLLIYEYMPNGSLDSHLFGGKSILPWQVRYNIALGLASALLYLQEKWENCVLHRDIKSSNIMLDSIFNAKLGDFGLARLVDHEKGSKTTVMAGTLGYLAPEYINTGKATKESDIFSLGVVLLEVATGRKAIHHNDMVGQVSLVKWVWELYGLENLLAAADPKLCGALDVQQMECLVVVGLWCAHPDCTCRPSTRQVNKVLNFEGSLPILPQEMPVLAYPPPTTTELFFTVPSFFQATS